MKRVFLLAALGAGTAFAVDFSGAWDADVELDAGSGTASFEFHQTGNKLSGTYSGMLGQAKVTGTVDGKRVTWSFHATPEGGDPMTVTYSGQLAADGSIEGDCEYGGLGKGTFKATKKNDTRHAGLVRGRARVLTAAGS